MYVPDWFRGKIGAQLLVASSLIGALAKLGAAESSFPSAVGRVSCTMRECKFSSRLNYSATDQKLEANFFTKMHGQA